MQTAPVQADGTFAFDLARSEPCEVSYQSTGGEKLYPRKKFEPTPNRSDLHFETLIFRGVVVGPDGKPTRLRRGILCGPETVRFITGGDGRVELSELDPGTYTWKFKIPPRGYYPPSTAFVAGAAAEEVCKVQPGTPLEIVQTGKIRAPVLRAFYFVEDFTRRELTISSGLRLDTDRIGVIWPVDATTGIIETDAACAYFSVHPGAKQINIQLVESGTLEVALFDRAGKPLQHHAYRLTRTDGAKGAPFVPPLATGEFGRGAAQVPAGTYRVDVTFPDRTRASKPITLPRGGFETLEIREIEP